MLYGILRIHDLIDLENVKFGFKFVNDLLLKSINKCIKKDSYGKDLLKTHCYNTRNKSVPNLPRSMSTKYLNSVLCQGPKTFSELPTCLKNSRSLYSFCRNYKKRVLSTY